MHPTVAGETAEPGSENVWEQGRFGTVRMPARFGTQGKSRRHNSHFRTLDADHWCHGYP